MSMRMLSATSNKDKDSENIGRRVRVTEGIFEGVEGVIVKVNNGTYIPNSVTLAIAKYDLNYNHKKSDHSILLLCFHRREFEFIT